MGIRRSLQCGWFVAVLAVAVVAAGTAEADQASSPAGPVETFDDAQYLFYSGRYEEAAAIALALRASRPDDLATFELRTSALHFQLKRLLGDAKDKDKAFKACEACPAIRDAFLEDFAAGRAIAQAQVEADPDDLAARFFLGKIDLNYVWLQLGTIGRRTGWKEYWEARKSLDAVLKVSPGHVRARVARAWIDYIVDTRMTRGFRWILGGGNKKRALATVREVAAASGDRFEQAEAGFAHWEMEVQEKNFPEAVAAARDLAETFPQNEELWKFIAKHAAGP
jgi:tetratricopeptide (TPR) repeat protein